MAPTADQPSKSDGDRWYADLESLERLVHPLGIRLLLHEKAATWLDRPSPWDIHEGSDEELLFRGVFDASIMVIGVSATWPVAGSATPSATWVITSAGRPRALLSRHSSSYNGITILDAGNLLGGTTRVKNGELLSGEHREATEILGAEVAWRRYQEAGAVRENRGEVLQPEAPPRTKSERPPAVAVTPVGERIEPVGDGPATPPWQPEPRAELPIRSQAELRRWIEQRRGDVDEDDLTEWASWPVPGSQQRVFIPRTFDEEWDRAVKTVDSVIETDDDDDDDPLIGWIRRTEICRTGTIWFLAFSGDGPPDIVVVGEFLNGQEALAACEAKVAELG